MLQRGHVETPQALWLTSVRTRVGLLNGTLTIRSGQGTGVFLVPVGALRRGPSGYQGGGYGVLSRLRGVAY